ncbi:ABC transporter permease [Streptomyces varsoviensis]|uniref:Membrane protein n=1 Tax=Streptomyces varsoviensis TaxID=67373 RepID=A0ABR5IW75_9ACTN|nr:ABC transporter permease [Streptomyces varsoviensis]KOG85400.1 membrane protein [Streptomyces varsoviensis]
MNGRVARIELRRSVAPWAGALVPVFALALLYLIPGPWAWDTVRWTEQWTSLAMWTRSLLVFLWPLVLGLGALQGLRDHRSAMGELLTSTPRPAWHRAATLAGTIALTLVAGFALLLVVGGAQVLAGGAYQHLGWLPISLVAALALIAAAVLGMGLGRTLPSPLTPPALTVAAFVFTNLLRTAEGPAIPSPAAPNRLVLLSPAVSQVREVLLTLSAPVHLGQTLWLLGLAATGFALLAAATRRGRLLAVAPVLAGSVLALLVLPSDPRRTYVVDTAAAAMVCEGRVCVTKLHEARLHDLAGPGEKALRLLHGALGARAPVEIRESTGLRDLLDTPERSRTAVLVDFGDGAIGKAKGEELTRALLGQGLAPACAPRSEREGGSMSDIVAQDIAAAWVLGDLKPLPGTAQDPDRQTARALPVWKRFRALPPAEQRARIDAVHEAALACGDSGALDQLPGGASR